MKLPDFGKHPGLIRLKQDMGIATDQPDASWRDDYCMSHGEPVPCRECEIIEANNRWPV